MPEITLECPRCESDAIRLPNIQAPEGYAFDADLVLISCSGCGLRAPMTRFTRVDGERVDG